MGDESKRGGPLSRQPPAQDSRDEPAICCLVRVFLSVGSVQRPSIINAHWTCIYLAPEISCKVRLDPAIPKPRGPIIGQRASRTHRTHPPCYTQQEIAALDAVVLCAVKVIATRHPPNLPDLILRLLTGVPIIVIKKYHEIMRWSGEFFPPAEIADHPKNHRLLRVTPRPLHQPELRTTVLIHHVNPHPSQERGISAKFRPMHFMRDRPPLQDVLPAPKEFVHERCCVGDF